MTDVVAPDFRTLISQRIESAHETLAARWVNGVKHLVPVAASEIFPGEKPLDNVADLIQQLAMILRAPSGEPLTANAVATAKAAEIGRLRHAQRASVHQVVREYQTLRTVLGRFVEEEIERLRLVPNVTELLTLLSAVNEAVEALLQITVDTFVSQYTEAITQHTSQLEAFSRMVTHELRQPLGTLQFALKLLTMEDTWADADKRLRLLTTAERNVVRMSETLGKLVTLAHAEAADTALLQHVELSAVIEDVVGQLQEMADVREVRIMVVGPFAAVTADRARLELVLVNLISNAIKYSDPTKASRFIELSSPTGVRADICTICVRDNGIGIADPDLRSIFSRFYRGRADLDPTLGTTGLGLGLSIVADCVAALKGAIRVESTLGEGTTFSLDLPVAANT